MPFAKAKGTLGVRASGHSLHRLGQQVQAGWLVYWFRLIALMGQWQDKCSKRDESVNEDDTGPGR